MEERKLVDLMFEDDNSEGTKDAEEWWKINKRRN